MLKKLVNFVLEKRIMNYVTKLSLINDIEKEIKRLKRRENNK